MQQVNTANVSKRLFDFQTYSALMYRRLWHHLTAQPLSFFNVCVKPTRHVITTAQLLYWLRLKTKEKWTVALWAVFWVSTVNDTICQTVITEKKKRHQIIISQVSLNPKDNTSLITKLIRTFQKRKHFTPHQFIIYILMRWKWTQIYLGRTTLFSHSNILFLLPLLILWHTWKSISESTVHITSRVCG